MTSYLLGIVLTKITGNSTCDDPDNKTTQPSSVYGVYLCNEKWHIKTHHLLHTSYWWAPWNWLHLVSSQSLNNAELCFHWKARLSPVEGAEVWNPAFSRRDLRASDSSGDEVSVFFSFSPLEGHNVRKGPLCHYVSHSRTDNYKRNLMTNKKTCQSPESTSRQTQGDLTEHTAARDHRGKESSQAVRRAVGKN